MSAGDIAERLQRSRQRIQQIAERDDFPDPYQEVKFGRIWLAADVEAWIERRWQG
jgi:predicted DNA-binding transcriptional regulator AlpA